MVFSGRIRGLSLVLFSLVATPAIGQSGSSESNWQIVRPGGATGCAFNTPFEFWIREGDATQLLIYLQGGGACWSLESCDPRRGIAFDPGIDSTDFSQRRSGIFRRSNPANPFRNYTQIFVPYCTGDFHLGNREVSYRASSGDTVPGISVRHVGIRNLNAVIGYLSARKVRPRRVVVSGGSAGAIASPVLAGLIAGVLSDAEVVQIGDGVAGIHNVEQARMLMSAWGADSVLRTLGVPVDSAGDLFTAIYRSVGSRHPGIHFSQIATDSDAVVSGWLQRFGHDPARLAQNIRDTYRELREAGLCFNGYQLAGSDHTILWRDDVLTVRTARGLLIDQIKRDVLETPCSIKTSQATDGAAFLFSYRIRAGQSDSFVAGYRRHLDWHAQHQDSLQWLAWNVVDGPDQGVFVDGTFGINFGAFDRRVDPPGDGADFGRNVAPYVEPLSRETFRLRPDLSSGQRLEENRAGPMTKVVPFSIRPGELSQFEQAARTVRSTVGTNFSIYQRVSGGDQAEFLLMLQLDGWKDLSDRTRDPSVALITQTKSILQAQSSVWSYQAALTYTPRQ